MLPTTFFEPNLITKSNQHTPDQSEFITKRVSRNTKLSKIPDQTPKNRENKP